jgi:hypothetical protein
LHSEVNLLIQYIILQDQDGQNNIRKYLKGIGINTRNGLIWLRRVIIGEPL